MVMPASRATYAGQPYVNVRTAGGALLGSPTKRFVASTHIPEGYTPPVIGETQGYGNTYSQIAADGANGHNLQSVTSGTLVSVDMVGPDNPVVQIRENWSACWDDQAGAVYYYNHISGEATWLPPPND
jgi:hypothetical protein